MSDASHSENSPPDQGKDTPIQETIELNPSTDTTPGGDGTQRIPKSFGRYQLEKTLGEGAMGAVYLAHDKQLDRKVALKVPKFSKGVNQKVIKRFYQEAKSAATLDHPNICSVYDVGEIDGVHYISMAYVKGQSLSDFVNSDDPPSQRSIVRVVRKIALALAEAHSQGVIHRDLKPANIMLDQRKEPIVMDFGLARQIEKNDDARLTQDGTILGSPAYMSPEQLEGKPDKIGPSCDVYGLGVLFYELLTGELPFQGSGSVMSVIGEVFSKPPPNAVELRSDLDSQLAKFCMKAMAKKSSDRFSSMTEFAKELTAYLKREGSVESGESMKASPSKKSDASLIRIQEQVKLARTLCEEQQFAAATSILEKIAKVTDPQASKFVEWSKKELPKVESLASKTQGVDLAKDFSSDNLLGDDVFTHELANAPSPVTKPTIQAASPTTKRKFPSWALWLIPIPLIIVFGCGSLMFAWQFMAPPEEVSKATDSENESTANEKKDSKNQKGKGEFPNRPFVRPGEDFLPPRNADQIMSNLDANFDGLLSEDEIPHFELGFLAFADQNGDNQLSSSELEEHVRIGRPDGKRDERISEVVERVLEYDLNDDEQLSRNEMPLLMRHLLRGGDADENSALDYEELFDLLEEALEPGPLPGGPRDRPPFGPGKGDRIRKGGFDR